MDETVYNVMSGMHNMYTNDDMVKNMAAGYEANPNPGLYDPRIMLGGAGGVARKYLPVFLNAPAVILIAGDSRAISGADINVGICGQNMILAAMSLGIRACWVGFSQVINMVPPIRDKIGLEPPWAISSSVVLGYPKFKQDGMVAREYRPVTWFREGSEAREIEE